MGQRREDQQGVWCPLLGSGVHQPGHQQRRRASAPRHQGQDLQHARRVKEETEPRWLEPVAIDDSTFGLVESWEQLKLPPTVSGKTLGAVLQRLHYWQLLLAEYEARGEWLRPYSLRDTFSVRAHGIVKDDTLIAAAMGHSVEVHHRSYRTTEWRSVRTAFAQGGGRHAASPSKRQQQIQQQQ